MPKLINNFIIVPHDPNWFAEYERIRDYFSDQIGDLVIEFKHVGSTRVPGLCAKPIIDVAAVIGSYEVFPEIISRLEKIGFTHLGDRGVNGREAFKREIPDDFTDYHFYIYTIDNEENRRQSVFLNTLLENKKIADEYGKLKMRIYDEANGDRESYTERKTQFISGVIGDKKPEVLITGRNLSLRTACLSDAEFIGGVETEPGNSPWVSHWPLGERIQKFGDEDCLQTIIELKKCKTPIGFVIFLGMLKKDERVCLKRIAICDAHKSMGYGKEALRLSQMLVFEIYNAGGLVLSTRPENLRAQGFYKKTGFLAENLPGRAPDTHFYITKEGYDKIKMEENDEIIYE